MKLLLKINQGTHGHMWEQKSTILYSSRVIVSFLTCSNVDQFLSQAEELYVNVRIFLTNFFRLGALVPWFHHHFVASSHSQIISYILTHIQNEKQRKFETGLTQIALTWINFFVSSLVFIVFSLGSHRRLFSSIFSLFFYDFLCFFPAFRLLCFFVDFH